METDGENNEVQLDGELFEGMRGIVNNSKDCVETDGYPALIKLYRFTILSHGFFSMYTSPVRGLRTVEGNRVICVTFKDPVYPKEFIFPSERLQGAKDPPNVLKPGKITICLFT